ncbi:MAG TPA: hypothetical protein VF188_11445 [Longimicrobiales bacterium]
MRLRTLNLLAVAVIGLGSAYTLTPTPLPPTPLPPSGCTKVKVLVCDDTGACHHEYVLLCQPDLDGN